jgi:hypothetical protein
VNGRRAATACLIRTAARSGSFGGVAEGDRNAGGRRRRVEIGGGRTGCWLDCAEARGDFIGFLFGLLRGFRQVGGGVVGGSFGRVADVAVCSNRLRSYH